MRRSGNEPGIASLVCGILALVFFLMLINIPLAIAAIVLGIVQLVSREKKLPAILGLAFATLSLLLMLTGWTAVFYGINHGNPQLMQQLQQELLRQYQRELQ